MLTDELRRGQGPVWTVTLAFVHPLDASPLWCPQVRLRGRDPVHLRAEPHRARVPRARVQVPAARGGSPAAGRGGRQALHGLRRLGDFLPGLPTGHLPRPALQGQVGAVGPGLGSGLSLRKKTLDLRYRSRLRSVPTQLSPSADPARQNPSLQLDHFHNTALSLLHTAQHTGHPGPPRLRAVGCPCFASWPIAYRSLSGTTHGRFYLTSLDFKRRTPVCYESRPAPL